MKELSSTLMAHSLCGASTPFPSSSETSCDKHTVCSHHSTKEPRKLPVNCLVKEGEHLAAKEPDIFFSGVGGEQTKANRRVDIGITFVVWLETQLQMTGHEIHTRLYDETLQFSKLHAKI